MRAQRRRYCLRSPAHPVRSHRPPCAQPEAARRRGARRGPHAVLRPWEWLSGHGRFRCSRGGEVPDRAPRGSDRDLRRARSCSRWRSRLRPRPARSRRGHDRRPSHPQRLSPCRGAMLYRVQVRERARKGISLRTKIGVLVAVFLMIGSASAGTVAYRQMTELTHEAGLEHARAVLDALAIPAAVAIATHDYTKLDNFIAELERARGRDILLMIVVDREGRLLATSGTGIVGRETT